MGFLSNLLPAIAGGALVATGVGAPAAAAMLGGFQYARTGSLQKGLLAGMGAYGGYGMGEGLSAMGQGVAADAAAAKVPGMESLTDPNFMGPQGISQDTADAVQSAREAAIKGAQATPFETMGKGISSAFQNPSQFANTMTGKDMLRSGLAAAAPALAATSNQPMVNPTDSNPGQRYAYSPGAVNPTPAPDLNPNMGGGFGREQRYYTPSYRKISDEEAKSIYGYADGGEVQGTKADPLAFYHARQAEAAAQPAPKQVDVAGDYANYIKGLNPAPAPTNPDAGKVPEYKAPQYDYDPSSADFTPEQARANLGKATSSLSDWATEFNKNNPMPTLLRLAPSSGYGFDPATQKYMGSGAPAEPAVNPNVQPANMESGGGFAGGGPVEAMSNANALGENTGYPQADISGHAYATPWQTPISQNVVEGTADTGVNRMTGQMLATGGIADAHYNLGGYSDGGRLLRGPGDGVSDSIPAVIGNKRPARLADGEFVVPARIVSELGNGSTEAGARKLYAMMDRVQATRKKSIGKNKVAHNSRADKYLPA